MDISTRLDLARICRVCLQMQPNLTSIFKDGLSDILSECTKLTVEPLDGMPDKMCLKCIDKAQNSFIFKRQCEKSHQLLLEQLEKRRREHSFAQLQYFHDDVVVVKQEPSDVGELHFGESMPTAQVDLASAVNLSQMNEHVYKNKSTSFCKLAQVKKVKNITEVNSFKQDRSTSGSQPQNMLEDTKWPVNAELNYADDAHCDNPMILNCKVEKEEFNEQNHHFTIIHNAEQNYYENYILDETADKHKPYEAHTEDSFTSDELYEPYRKRLKKAKIKKLPYDFAQHAQGHGETKFSLVNNSGDAHHSKKFEKDYRCTKCELSFPHLTALKQHCDQQHTEDKRFKCKFCPKSYSEQRGLNWHMHIHSEVKPFKCNQCAKTFTRSTYLNAHVQSHSGVKPFQCAHCPKTFSYKGHLNAHNMLHTGERPYKCEICPKTFTKSYNMKLHMKSHKNKTKPTETLIDL